MASVDLVDLSSPSMPADAAATSMHHPLDEFCGDKTNLDQSSDVQKLGEKIQAMVAAAHPAYVPELIQAQATKIQKKLKAGVHSDDLIDKTGVDAFIETLRNQASDAFSGQDHNEKMLEQLKTTRLMMSETKNLLELELEIIRLRNDIRREHENQ